MNELKNKIEELKKIFKPIIKDRKLMLIVGAIVAAILLMYFGRIDVPTQPLEPPQVFKTKPEEQETWNEYVPGITKYSEVENDITNYPGVKEFDLRRAEKGMRVYEYTSSEAVSRNHLFGVDRTDTLKFIRVPIPFDGNQKQLSEWQQNLQLGEPDIVKYDNLEVFELAMVYLDKGVMLSVHEGTQLVHNITYFEPMTADEFLRFWGHNLVDEYIPHQHPPRF